MLPENRREQFTSYTAILRERIETKGILHELAGCPNFVVWRFAFIDGQRKKPPFDPNTHQPASPIEPQTWGTIETVLTALATGKYNGIGFMLSHSPFAGIDLDHCIEGGNIQQRAQEIIKAMATYTEYSPSWNMRAGTGGVHLLVEGKPARSIKVGNIEVYGEKQYLTITTNHLPGTPTTIESRQQALDALYRRIAPPVVERSYQNTSGGEGRGDDLTELPQEAAHDQVLQKLLRGDITGYKSQSRADFVLVLKLLHWTGDNIALTRRFLLSPAYTEKTRPSGKPARRPILI